MKRIVVTAALALAVPLAGCGSSATDQQGHAAPAALVTTVMPARGSLPRLIEGYGTAAPAANGVATLNVPQPGQVVALPVVAGARVAAGQAVVVFAVAPSARSTYVQAGDALRAAEAQRRTTSQLLADQLATRDQFVQAEKAVADARATLSALVREGAGATMTTLRAPFAGVVATLPVALGDRTQAGQALATVAREGTMVVTVGVDPAERSAVAVGAPAELRRIDAPARAIGGRVARVDAMLNPRTRQVDVDIAYPAGALVSGEAVRAGVRVGMASGWVVPHRAVVVEDGNARVFQMVGGKAKAVPVAVLVAGANRDCVSGAVDPRAPLIVDGAYQAGDGDPVRTSAPRTAP